MQRLSGRYSIRSAPVQQLDHQIEPTQWTQVTGYKLPIQGPFTQVIANRGIAVLYVSQPGEVPLYYSTTPGWIHWHEQKLALPGKPQKLRQGNVAIWTPKSCCTLLVDELPRPEITDPIPQTEAIAQYQQRIIAAVRRRLGGRCKVAVAQSGGTDSLLVTWALLKLGVEVVPLTVATTNNDLDIVGARHCCRTMGVEPIPIWVKQQSLPDLLREALICLEDTEDSNVRMAIGNILMARKCNELGIDLIFNGHGHDDVFGKGTLIKGVVAQQIGTDSERWRDARRLGTEATAGMVKMFASTFRRYGVEVRMPYYDADLLEWAFSQPVEVLPIEFKKQFVHRVVHASLPVLMEQKHSIGYLTGAGLSLKQALLKGHPMMQGRSLRAVLAEFRKQALSDRIEFHRKQNDA